MVITIFAAGYIVADDQAIWGAGATADAAEADFQEEMAAANITLRGDYDYSDEVTGAWTLASKYQTQPATAALLAKVEENGGNISWGKVGSVCCTREEEDACLSAALAPRAAAAGTNWPAF